MSGFISFGYLLFIYFSNFSFWMSSVLMLFFYSTSIISNYLTFDLWWNLAMENCRFVILN